MMFWLRLYSKDVVELGCERTFVWEVGGQLELWGGGDIVGLGV